MPWHPGSEVVESGFGDEEVVLDANADAAELFRDQQVVLVEVEARFDCQHHARAQAADWHCPAVGRPVEVCRLLAPHIDSLGIGQIINEFPGAAGGWIHTSIARPAREVNRVITIARSGTFPGILEVA